MLNNHPNLIKIISLIVITLSGLLWMSLHSLKKEKFPFPSDNDFKHFYLINVGAKDEVCDTCFKLFRHEEILKLWSFERMS